MRKNYTHNSNTTCFVTGSMVLYRITPQSGIDHDLVSVVKILLKAFFCSLCEVTNSVRWARSYGIHPRGKTYTCQKTLFLILVVLSEALCISSVASCQWKVIQEWLQMSVPIVCGSCAHFHSLRSSLFLESWPQIPLRVKLGNTGDKHGVVVCQNAT
jgi:hypothetical protein